MGVAKLLQDIKDNRPWGLEISLSSNPLISQRWTVSINPVGCGVYSCGINPTIVHGEELEDTLEDGIAKASARKFKFIDVEDGFGMTYAEEIFDG